VKATIVRNTVSFVIAAIISVAMGFVYGEVTLL
jgi:hypothetical protein